MGRFLTSVILCQPKFSSLLFQICLRCCVMIKTYQNRQILSSVTWQLYFYSSIYWNLTCGIFVVVNVKWGKEKFKDIECNTDEPLEVFKAQLFALSGVQPDRQKIMIKGAVLKVYTFNIKVWYEIAENYKWGFIIPVL